MHEGTCDELPPREKDWMVARIVQSAESASGNINFRFINVRNREGFTALMIAVRSNNADAVQRLLDGGADPNIRRSLYDNYAALSFCENSEILKMLVRCGVEFSCERGLNFLHRIVESNLFEELIIGNRVLFEKQRYDFDTAIIIASRSQGYEEVLDALLQHSDELCLNVSLLRTESTELIQRLVLAGVDINTSDDQGQTALHKAVLSGNLPLVIFLVDCKANIEAVDKNGDTALLLSASFSLEIMEYFMSCGANVLCINKKEETPLSKIVMYGALHEIELLVENGLDIWSFTYKGKNAIHYAIERENIDMAKFFINIGVNVNMLTSDLKSPLSMAADKRDLLTARLLIDEGADINICNAVGDNALNIALNRGSEGIAKLLLESGADVNYAGFLGVPPLTMAVDNLMTNLVLYMLNRGADINQVDCTGRTALFQAVLKRDHIIVHELIDGKANVNIANQDNITPLLLAIWFGELKFVQLFIQHGASVNNIGVNVCQQDLDPNNAVSCQVIHSIDTILKNTCTNDTLHVGYDSLCIPYIPLHLAIELEREQIFYALLEAGADVSTTDCHRNSAIHYAAQCSNKAFLQHFLINFYKSSPKDHKDLCQEQAATCFPQTSPINDDCHLNEPGPKKIKPSHDINLLSNLVANFFSKTVENNERSNIPETTEGNTIVNQFSSLGTSSENKQKPCHSIDSLDIENISPLHIAAYNNRAESVKMLIEAGCDVNIETRRKETALLIALSKGFDEIGEMLLKSGAYINITNEDNESLFLISVKCECVKSFNTLINIGVNIYETNRDGATALHYLPIDEIAETLIDLGLNVQQEDRFGRFPLHVAVLTNDIRFVNFLLEKGADVNATTCTGNTALSLASEHADINSDMIRYLLNHGAYMDKDNKDLGDFVLIITHKLIENPSKDNRKEFNAIIKFGFNLNLQDDFGCTALMYLARYCNRFNEEIKNILSNGANINLKDNLGRTALAHSLMSGSNGPREIEFLLRYGAEPHLEENQREILNDWIQKDKDYRTILFFQQSDFVRLYVCNGIVFNLYRYGLSKPSYRFDSFRYLLANCCLIFQDVQQLVRRGFPLNDDVSTPRTHGRQQSSNKNDETGPTKQLLMEPWPLVKLAFLEVSSILGDGPERQRKVKETPLPLKIQQMLLFQTPLARLPTSEWPDIPLCFDPVQYETLSRPRPLLYYWPIGRVYKQN